MVEVAEVVPSTEPEIVVTQDPPSKGEDVSLEENPAATQEQTEIKELVDSGVLKADDPEPVQKRINKMWNKQKASEKKANDYEKSLNQSNSDMKVMKKFHGELLESYEKVTNRNTEATEAKTVSDQKAQIDTQIAQLKVDRKEATAEQDTDKADQINDEILELRESKKEIKAPVVEKDAGETNTTTEPDNDLIRFTIDNTWADASHVDYNKDMVQEARLVDNALLRKPAWKNKPDSERYIEIAKVVNKRFSKNGDNGNNNQVEIPNAPQRVNKVEGSEDSRGTKVTTVRLSPEQMNYCAISGTDPKVYAKNLLIIEGKSGRKR